MKEKPNFLFVCTINRMRSATAHQLFSEDERFTASSAGTDTSAATPLSRDLLEWADSIIVMEKHHRNFIRKHYPDIYSTKRIVCMYIPDEYDFMDPFLIILLRERMDDLIRRKLV